MQIRLRGDIVILDEAHNIEDICREAANVILRDDEINTAIMDCHHLSAVYRDKYHDPNTAAVYDTIEKYFEDFVKFIQKIDVEQNKNVSRYTYQIINYNFIFVFTLILCIIMIY